MNAAWPGVPVFVHQMHPALIGRLLYLRSRVAADKNEGRLYPAFFLEDIHKRQAVPVREAIVAHDQIEACIRIFRQNILQVFRHRNVASP